MKKCQYCEKQFKPIANRNITCGRDKCLKARKRDYHRAYMQRKKPRTKRLAYYIEYSQRHEVKKHIQKYQREYYQKKKVA